VKVAEHEDIENDGQTVLITEYFDNKHEMFLDYKNCCKITINSKFYLL